MKARTWVVVLAAGLALSACQTAVGEQTIPGCDEITAALILEAQAVPSASQILCVDALEPGWAVADFEARNGSARIVLDSDRAGLGFLEVTLAASCESGAAEEVDSDDRGTRLLVDTQTRRDPDDPEGGTYTGSWYYLFRGGCITYTFNAEGDEVADLPADAAAALSVFPRAVLCAAGRENPKMPDNSYLGDC